MVFVKYGYSCCTKCVNIDGINNFDSQEFENGNQCGILFNCLDNESSDEESSFDDEDLDSNEIKEIIENGDDALINTESIVDKL